MTWKLITVSLQYFTGDVGIIYDTKIWLQPEVYNRGKRMFILLKFWVSFAPVVHLSLEKHLFYIIHNGDYIHFIRNT